MLYRPRRPIARQGRKVELLTMSLTSSAVEVSSNLRFFPVVDPLVYSLQRETAHALTFLKSPDL
jgi:hypothetical protein